MKTIILITILFVASSIYSQSVLTLGSGTTLGVLSGADMCANVINGSAFVYGGGTLCGGLVSVDPVASSEIPQAFDLLQNYPNPFNPVTVIKYQLPQSAYTSIKLFDQLGREARVLYEGEHQAGYYQLSIDGRNLASGIYFCKLSAGNFTKVIKMMLVK